MISIRLKRKLSFDHFEIPAGRVIGVDPDIAHDAVQQTIAELAEPERMVVEPRETRAVRRNRQ